MRRQICLLPFVLFSLSMSAVPARRGLHTMSQPNGDSIRVELIGDEWWHAYYTEDGYMIVQGEDGWWRYVRYTGKRYTDGNGFERKQCKATLRKVHAPEQRRKCEKRWLQKKGVKQ